MVLRRKTWQVQWNDVPQDLVNRTVKNLLVAVHQLSGSRQFPILCAIDEASWMVAHTAMIEHVLRLIRGLLPWIVQSWTYSGWRAHDIPLPIPSNACSQFLGGVAALCQHHLQSSPAFSHLRSTLL